MSRRTRQVLTLLVAVVVVLLWWWGDQRGDDRRGDQPPPTTSSHAGGSVALADLPPEAQQTVRLIRQGGPFPYDRDGVVFENRERLLPEESRGYYHEYTVPTPGSDDRGARRIVTGGDTMYYTDDHYRSFRRIEGLR